MNFEAKDGRWNMADCTIMDQRYFDTSREAAQVVKSQYCDNK